MIKLLVPDPSLAKLAREIERAIRDGQAEFETLPANYANDAAAALGGIPVNGIYRNGSVLMIRVS